MHDPTVSRGLRCVDYQGLADHGQAQHQEGNAKVPEHSLKGNGKIIPGKGRKGGCRQLAPGSSK